GETASGDPGPRRGASEGLLAVVVARGLTARGLTGTDGAGAPAPATSGPAITAGAPALVLGDLGRRPAKARTDLVGHHLDLRSPLTFGVLPAALVEPTGDDHPRAPDEALAGVLGHLPPADHVEEGGGLLPLLGLP